MFLFFRNIYIKGSLHVALAALSLAYISLIGLGYDNDIRTLTLVFFSTLAGYNIVKFYPFFLKQKTKPKNRSAWFLTVFALTLLAFFIVGFLLIQAPLIAFFGIILTSLLTLLYITPVLYKQTMRSYTWLKINTVALCWVLMTVFIPLTVYQSSVNEIITESVLRFVFVWIWILPFEIRDTTTDNNLRTLPQIIGIKNTKYLGYCLSFLYIFLLSFCQFKPSFWYTIHLFGIGLLLLFTWFSSEKRSFWYTAFLGESIPIIMLVLTWLIRD